MKRSITQTLLNILPPEPAHKLRLALLGGVCHIPTAKWFLGRSLAPRQNTISREVFGVHFDNPIGIAAGFDPNGDYIDELSTIGFGFIEIGSVIAHAQPGTPRPRLRRLRTAHSLVDNSGYPSRGLEYVLNNVRHRNSKTQRITIGCNIGNCTSTPAEQRTKEYLRVFRNMYQYVDFFVINIACNTAVKPFAPTSREDILELIEPLFEFRRGQLDYRPILLKISPDLTQEQLDEVIDILIETPLDGIEAVAGSRDIAPNSGGAITGAVLTERAIEMVRYITEKTEGNYPIIGCGGMMQPDDIKRMFEAGASLVALNTGLRENGFRLLREATKALTTETPSEPQTQEPQTQEPQTQEPQTQDSQQ